MITPLEKMQLIREHIADCWSRGFCAIETQETLLVKFPSIGHSARLRLYITTMLNNLSVEYDFFVKHIDPPCLTSIDNIDWSQELGDSDE